MVGFGELRTDLVTCFRDLDNICEQLSNFGKGAFVGFQNGSNYKWDKLRKGIIKHFTEATVMLEVDREKFFLTVRHGRSI